MQCPTREELTDCLLGRVPPSRADALLDHAEQCDECHKLLDRLDAETDAITQTLGRVTDPPSSKAVSDECERMIDRAESYMGSQSSIGAVASDANATTDQHGDAHKYTDAFAYTNPYGNASGLGSSGFGRNHAFHPQ